MNKDYKLNVNEIFASLCRHLSANNDITNTSKQFMSLETNLQRVDFAHNLLQQYGLFPNYTRVLKDDAQSAMYTTNGNEMFENECYEYALELYTKSIAFATNDSEQLGIAYEKRSGVLIKKEMNLDCLVDIERASKCKLSKSLRDVLLLRETELENLIGEEDEEIPFLSVIEGKGHEELPSFTLDPNPYIASAANCVAIQNASHLGRHVVATKDIQIGDIIAIEKPYAWIVLPESSLNHCHFCLAVNYSLIPCEHCTYALYCSEEHRDQAWNSFHKYECSITDILANLQVSKLNLMALRVAICARDEYINIKNYEHKNSVYESERYEEIHDLCANTQFRTNADLFDRALTSALIYEMVKRHSPLFSDIEDGEGVFKELLLHHMQTAPSNFHEISELVANDETVESQEIGAGAYSFLSMLNHSCTPNVVRHCYGKIIVLRALSPIKKGQQLFDNYGYHYAVMSKDERQKSLKNQYFFECTCEACVKDWPMYPDLTTMNFQFEVSQEDISALQTGSVEAAKKVLKGLLIKAAILEKMKPCKNLADIQECIKQCYSILGNKRFV